MNQDTNFDTLTEHFKKRIYGSSKGDIRLAVLQRDLDACLPDLNLGRLKVLDIGAGMAQIGTKLACMGHETCINDISQNMLGLAKNNAALAGVENHIKWHHGAFQSLDEKPYDLVLCHAVLEWLQSPAELITKLQYFTRNNSVVSLMFYNFDALVFHNLVRGNFKKIEQNDFSGMKGGLTPPNPLKPAWVEAQLHQFGFEVFYKSGVRVFSDYVGIKRGGNENAEDVLKLELRYSNQEPYINMGRYIHFMCKKRG